MYRSECALRWESVASGQAHGSLRCMEWRSVHTLCIAALRLLARNAPISSRMTDMPTSVESSELDSSLDAAACAIAGQVCNRSYLSSQVLRSAKRRAASRAMDCWDASKDGVGRRPPRPVDQDVGRSNLQKAHTDREPVNTTFQCSNPLVSAMRRSREN